MAQILKFPVRASKFGYKRVPKRTRKDENPAQLNLFPRPTAQVLQFTSGLGCFDRALMMDERGDAQAAEFYLQAIEAQDCVADAFCNLGILQSKAGCISKAFDCFTNCLKQDPRHFEAHYNLGNMYFEVNDFRLAQVHYELAAQLDPTFPNVYFNLALVLSLTNELAPALAALDSYQQLALPEERRKADELMQTLKNSLAAALKPRAGAS